MQVNLTFHQKAKDWIDRLHKKTKNNYMLFTRDTLKIQKHKRIESKGMEKDIPHKQ